MSVCISPAFLKLYEFHKICPWISHSGKLLSLYAVALTISQGCCAGGSLEKSPSSVLRGHLWMYAGGYLSVFSHAKIVMSGFAAIQICSLTVVAVFMLSQ